MERFINKKVEVRACLGGIDGSGLYCKGVVTSVDDEFLVLDYETYIVRKYILSITIK